MMQSIDTTVEEDQQQKDENSHNDMNQSITTTTTATSNSQSNDERIVTNDKCTSTTIITTDDDDDIQTPSNRIRRWEAKKQKYAALEDNFSPEFATTPNGRGVTMKRKKKKASVVMMLSEGDMNIFEQLDADYMRAIEERDIGWTARQESVRQNAGFSLIFMILYLISGSIYLKTSSSKTFTLGENLLFSIMSITTVGYSSMAVDTTKPSFQLFMILYILIGIATLTIMVAQVYQYIVLETERARSHHHDRNLEHTSSTTSSNTNTTNNNNNNNTNHSTNNATTNTNRHDLEAFHHHNDAHSTNQGVGEWVRKAYPVIKHFLRYNEVGQVMVVLSPFLGLTLIGALVVGTIEGWTFVESFYFAVVSLTTVGYGDYYPTQQGSIWFCVFWLPCSVGFMSFYLGLVGYWYLQLSSRNVKRVLQRKRKHFQRIKRRRQNELHAARTRALAAAGLIEPNTTTTTNNNNNNDNDHPNLIYDTSIQNTASSSKHGNRISEEEEIEERGERRRQRIQQNSFHCGNMNGGRTSQQQDVIQSMRDLIEAVRYNSNNDNNNSNNHFSRTNNNMEALETSHDPSMDATSKKAASGNISFLSLKAVDKIEMGKETRKKPTFALRVLVQERLADIIAVDIAGYQNHVDMKDTTLSITMNKLTYAADKWHIPQTARNAFRAVSFEVLYFIGEHALITRGSDALFDLTPHEFHKLFAPLIASMGDFDTMSRWLSFTEVLSEADLRRSSRYSLLDPPQSYSNLDDDDPFDSHTIT